MSNIKVNSIEAQSGNSIVSNSFIKFNSDPIDPNDLANKAYVDSLLSGSEAGVPASYVDTQDQYYANLAQSKYIDKLSGASETINGSKTFSNVPVCSSAPVNSNDLVNKNYVDQQDAITLNQTNQYVDAQIASMTAVSNSFFSKYSLPQGVTGSNSVYSDGTNTAKDRNYFYATDNTYFLLEGKNGLTITGSRNQETFNIVSNSVVTSVTETVNRIIIDANSLGSSNQSWQNQTGTKIANNTWYLNTTDKPIQVLIKPNSGCTATISTGFTSTSPFAIFAGTCPTGAALSSFIVPIGHGYKVSITPSSQSPTTVGGGSWWELK